jgi:hypothetical protein
MRISGFSFKAHLSEQLTNGKTTDCVIFDERVKYFRRKSLRACLECRDLPLP